MMNKKNKLNTSSIALAAAVWSALLMLVIWLLANMGLYVSAAEQMSKWHMFFNLTVIGLVIPPCQNCCHSWPTLLLS